MQVLFLHNNFPAQFGRLGEFLISNGVDVWFGTQRKNSAAPGVKVFNYAPHRQPDRKTHPYVRSFESASINGQAVARAAIEQQKRGLAPDIVVAHSGWGPGLYVKEVWPKARYIGYFEWYYHANSPDILHFKNENQSLDEHLCRQGRNAAILADLVNCDAGVCPTRFQWEQLPDIFRSKVQIIHDGVDTETYKRKPDARRPIENLVLKGDEQFITYVARGMEPYRGFPEFMKALELIQRARPNVHAIIVGEDRVAYGKKLKDDDSFKKRALSELDLDLGRTHFTGLVPRNRYREILQASNVHAYLTIPFVLSWSMMEAMSAECAIVASDTAPVREMIDDDAHGVLADMTKPEAVADAITGLLDDEDKCRRLGRAARDRIVFNYDSRDLHQKLWRLIAKG